MSDFIHGHINNSVVGKVLFTFFVRSLQCIDGVEKVSLMIDSFDSASLMNRLPAGASKSTSQPVQFRTSGRKAGLRTAAPPKLCTAVIAERVLY